MSLTATNSSGTLRSMLARTTWRPIRPKPLMPMRRAMVPDPPIVRPRHRLARHYGQCVARQSLTLVRNARDYARIGPGGQGSLRSPPRTRRRERLGSPADRSLFGAVTQRVVAVPLLIHEQEDHTPARAQAFGDDGVRLGRGSQPSLVHPHFVGTGVPTEPLLVHVAGRTVFSQF